MPEPSSPTPSPSNRRLHFKSRTPPAGDEPSDEQGIPHRPPPLGALLSLPEMVVKPPAAAWPKGEPDAPILTIAPQPIRPPATGGAVERKPAPAVRSEVADGLGEPALELPAWARRLSPPGPDRSAWWLALGGIALAAAAFGSGYALHDLLAPNVAAAPPNRVAPALAAATGELLTPRSQAALDGAYRLMHGSQPAEARAEFGELILKHPGWPQLELERARAAFYQHDAIGSKSILDAAEKNGRIAPADAEMMGGLLRMAASDFEAAGRSFAQAASCDPTRDDVYYFWGEALRRQGKPAEAASHFRSALLRNQREAMEGMYRFKLWMAEIQAELDAASGTGARLDAEIASPHPSGYALAADAARLLHAGNVAQAAEQLRRASQLLDDPVCRVILNDAQFAQEAYRPEFAEFYAPKPGLGR